MASNLLLGRIAIVTGAASGLGRATALAFAKQGAAVICADQKASQSHQPATHQLIINMGGKGIFAETDVSDSGSMEALVRKAVKEYGRLDIMVNNAGIASEAAHPRPIWETTEADFDDTHRVNVRGTFLGCKYAGAQMIRQVRQTNYQRAGTIINIGSVLGVLGFTGTPAYASTKGAVIAMTRAAAMDFASHNIHCNSILPGFTRTPMISSMTENTETESYMAGCHPFNRLGEPEEIADTAVFLASDMSKGITGVNLSVDGGLHAQLRL